MRGASMLDKLCPTSFSWDTKSLLVFQLLEVSWALVGYLTRIQNFLPDTNLFSFGKGNTIHTYRVASWLVTQFCMSDTNQNWMDHLFYICKLFIFILMNKLLENHFRKNNMISLKILNEMNNLMMTNELKNFKNQW